MMIDYCVGNEYISGRYRFKWM